MSRNRIAGSGALAAALALTLMLQACGMSRYVRPELDPICSDCVAAPGELDTRVVLIGDAGEDLPGSPNLALLTRLASEDPERTLVLFLGDNIYPRGMPSANDADNAEERDTAIRIIRSQADAVRVAGAEGIFVPGNHDWDHSGADGMARMIAQQAWIEAYDPSGAIRVLPRQACPGPVIVDRGERLRVVLMDSEWLLTPEERPRGESDCEYGAADSTDRYSPGANAGFYAELRRVVAGTRERKLLFANHHPIRTRGQHGSFTSLQYWIFPITRAIKWLYLPLPLLYPPVRYGIVRSDQDLVGGRNRAMVTAIEPIFAAAPQAPAVIASGHEHTLQVFDDLPNGLVQLVSGAGSKRLGTGKTAGTVFKEAVVGLMVLDYLKDGRVALRVHRPGGDELRPVFAMWLDS